MNLNSRWWSDCTANWRDKWTKVREIFLTEMMLIMLMMLVMMIVRSFFKGSTKKIGKG